LKILKNIIYERLAQGTDGVNSKLMNRAFVGYIGCSFKVVVEESVVNAPLVSLHSKNTNTQTTPKSEVRFKHTHNLLFKRLL
jgi:hypothetical protein